ncbi:MAG: DUF3798 domain-containing protein [Defluviitaleaceae bacterium]|nr:DUF3798 domain-containing protein [Defluviitaleaceae bacterium]
MKNKIFALIFLFAFAACVADFNDVTVHVEEKFFEEEIFAEEIFACEIKIAVVANDSESHWVAELYDRFPEKLLVYESAHEINDSQIKILITDTTEDEFHGLRDDVFVVSVGENFSDADLILAFDREKNQLTNPQIAREMGARTLVYFYNHFDFDENVELVEVGEPELLRRVREKSEEAGLIFVAFDMKNEIQCGSSYAWFLVETIPPLLEKYGNDILFFNLDNERIFWWRSYGMFYLPLYQEWFEPSPIDFAIELGIIDDKNISAREIPQLITEIKRAFAEKNQSARIASIPISPQVLFPFAAAEYGLKHARGEVSADKINMHVLEQIFSDLVVEYTGEHKKISLARSENGVVLVLPEYLFY